MGTFRTGATLLDTGGMGVGVLWCFSVKNKNGSHGSGSGLASGVASNWRNWIRFAGLITDRTPSDGHLPRCVPVGQRGLLRERVRTEEGCRC